VHELNLVVLKAAVGTIQAAWALVAPACVFAALALLTKRREALTAARRAAGEFRLNLGFYFFDNVLVLPLVTLLVAWVTHAVESSGIAIVELGFWERAGTVITFVAAIFFGDFAGYWRHRLQHMAWFWPAHAVHHSDKDMTWLTLVRMHPLDRLTTVGLDTLLLALLGFPTWALIANNFVRHYHGYWLHADLPWTYGPLGHVFVSPSMHQWHHAKDVRGSGSNFATVFSLFDRVFGTCHAPGVCTSPSGVTNDVGAGLIRQLAYPFQAWLEEPIRRLKLGRPRLRRTYEPPTHMSRTSHSGGSRQQSPSLAE
jgi:sterol desaturase/sphingolipid hydroxylase (fatty acid hydroxylase superfamily)